MSWLDALGWAGSALLIYSLLQARVLRLRVLNLVACLILVVFNALLEIWPMVAMNVVLSAINLWFIRKLVSDRHDEHAFEVLEVGPTDEYLRHVLRVHQADILKHQPDLSGTAPPRGAAPTSCSAGTRPSAWCWPARRPTGFSRSSSTT